MGCDDWKVDRSFGNGDTLRPSAVGGNDDLGDAAQRRETLLTEEVINLLTARNGFTNVEVTQVTAPDHLSERAGRTIEGYRTVTSDQGTFGLFFIHELPFIDLLGTGVTPAEYLPDAATHRLGESSIAPVGDANDIRRLATLLSAKSDAAAPAVSADDVGEDEDTIPATP